MAENQAPKGALKSYLLLCSLCFIAVIIGYEDRLPDLSLRLIQFADATYDVLDAFVHGKQPEPAPSVPRSAVPDAAAALQLSDFIRPDESLLILHPQAATTLNPHLSRSIKDWEPARIVYEPLASFDNDGNLIPILASEIPTVDNGGVAADGKSVTWKIRQDVTWSDGEAFTADDVLFTYEYVSNPDVKAASASTYTSIESIEVPDPYTVVIRFKNVTPAWNSPFVGILGVILPRHVFEPYNGVNAQQAEANKFPVGTGPYRAVYPGLKAQEVLLLGTQLVETNKIVFEQNPNFRDLDSLFFRRIEFRGGGTSAEAARLVMQEGSIDYAYELSKLPPAELAEFETLGKGRLALNFVPKVERIALNSSDPNQETADGERSSLEFPHPFFSDANVRRAFAHAIDREAIAEIYGAAGRPTTNNLVAPPQYNSPNRVYPFDMKKAEQLLDDAGWVDTDGDGVRDNAGLTMKVVFQAPVSEASQKSQQIVKKALETLGVEVVLKIVDSAIMYSPGAVNPDSAWRFNADLLQFPMTSNSPDPSGYMRFWTCDQIPQKSNNWSGLNFERRCINEYDRLYQQAEAELNEEKRRQMFIRMNDILLEEVVMIPLVHLANVQGVSRTLDGIDLTPWDMNTWNMKDWRRVSQ